MHFTPIYRKASLVSRERDSYSLNVAKKTLIALERKVENDHSLNAFF